jgi:acyl-CoA thioesterase I
MEEKIMDNLDKIRTALKKSSGMAGSESILYVALGDSVTAGWLEHGILDTDTAYPAQFRTRLAGLYPQAMISVLNQGLGGDNTEGVLARLERDCLSHNPHLVTICLGLNDSRKGSEYVPRFEANLREIVAKIKANTQADIILITPNCRESDEANAILTEFVRTIRAVSRSENIPLADVNAIYSGAIRMGATPADLLSNRISHPTREGHKIFVNALITLFQT